MNKDLLEKYILTLSKEEKDYTNGDYQTKYMVENDSNLNEFVRSIKSVSSTNDRYNILNNYIKQEELAKKSEEEKIKEALKKKFGIDLTNIDHMKLQSGIDIISFYDNRLGRKRLIDYSYAKSLTEEFTNIQNNNINFQTDDYESNSNKIAEQEANKNSKKELNMIDINRVKNEYFDLMNRIKNQDPTKIQCINELINEADKKKIKYINIENMVALDEDNNIIESFYNEKTEKVELETPEKISTSVDKVDNEEKIKDGLSNIDGDETNPDEMDNSITEVTPSDFETEEKIEDAEFLKEFEDSMNIYHIHCTKEEAMKNVVKYSNNMSLLEDDLNKNQITKDEYDFYSICCERYMNMKKKKLENAKVKKLTLEKGVVSALVVSIISIVFAIIVFIMSL